MFGAPHKTPLLGEREGPDAQRWEGEGAILPHRSLPDVANQRNGARCNRLELPRHVAKGNEARFRDQEDHQPGDCRQ